VSDLRGIIREYLVWHRYDGLAVALCHLARSGMVLDRCKEGEG
jgi:hypothetical protein